MEMRADPSDRIQDIHIPGRIIRQEIFDIKTGKAIFYRPGSPIREADNIACISEYFHRIYDPDQQSDSQYDIGYKSRDFAIRREFKTHVTNKTPY